MKVRFLTSVGGATCSFMEGRVIDLPDPAPAPFVEWLRRGIVEVVREADIETAVRYPAGERAVGLRGRHGRRRQGATALAE